MVRRSSRSFSSQTDLSQEDRAEQAQADFKGLTVEQLRDLEEQAEETADVQKRNLEAGRAAQRSFFGRDIRAEMEAKKKAAPEAQGQPQDKPEPAVFLLEKQLADVRGITVESVIQSARLEALTRIAQQRDRVRKRAINRFLREIIAQEPEAALDIGVIRAFIDKLVLE